MTYNWTTFTRKTYIKADVEQVFKAWATSSEIVNWFIAEANYTTPDGRVRAGDELAQAGDTYYWRWHQEIDTSGAVVQVVENGCIQYTFGTNSEGGTILVTVKFTQEGDETLLELTQSNIGDTIEEHARWHMGCNMGWAFFMTNLKAVMEHGADLRETNAERAAVTRAITL